jgi:hypothetical protein
MHPGDRGACRARRQHEHRQRGRHDGKRKARRHRGKRLSPPQTEVLAARLFSNVYA